MSPPHCREEDARCRSAERAWTVCWISSRRCHPAQIGHAENALRDARRRAEAVIEIDAAAEARACPHCGGAHNVRHGRTRTGIQRWRCLSCGRTWSGLDRHTGRRCASPRLARGDAPRHAGRPPALVPWLGRGLGRLASHHLALADARAGALGAARRPRVRGHRRGRRDLPAREPQGESREWVRHQRDPRHAKPPRLRWRAYGRGGPPKMPGCSPWQMPLLGVADRNGARLRRPARQHEAPDHRGGAPAARGPGRGALHGRRRSIRGHRPSSEAQALLSSTKGGAGRARRSLTTSTP